MQYRLGDEYKNASLSEGTLIVEDLVQSVTELISNEILVDVQAILGALYYARQYDHPQIVSFFEEELTALWNEDIYENLNAIAPEGYKFGPHPGNDSDFGFWKIEEEEEPDHGELLENQDFAQDGDFENMLASDVL